MTQLKNALEQVDGVSDIEVLQTDAGSTGENMLGFKYKDLRFMSLYVPSIDIDQAVGINFRCIFSIKTKTKKTKVQILNDINAFNHSKLGIKVVFLNIKDRDLELSFDVEKWTLENLITPETVKVDIDFMWFILSTFRAEHKYIG